MNLRDVALWAVLAILIVAVAYLDESLIGNRRGAVDPVDVRSVCRCMRPDCEHCGRAGYNKP